MSRIGDVEGMFPADFLQRLYRVGDVGDVTLTSTGTEETPAPPVMLYIWQHSLQSYIH